VYEMFFETALRRLYIKYRSYFPCAEGENFSRFRLQFAIGIIEGEVAADIEPFLNEKSRYN